MHESILWLLLSSLFYYCKAQVLHDGRGLSFSLNMLVTEQPRDHCVSECISPNELLLHFL